MTEREMSLEEEEQHEKADEAAASVSRRACPLCPDCHEHCLDCRCLAGEG